MCMIHGPYSTCSMVVTRIHTHLALLGQLNVCLRQCAFQLGSPKMWCNSFEMRDNFNRTGFWKVISAIKWMLSNSCSGLLKIKQTSCQIVCNIILIKSCFRQHQSHLPSGYQTLRCCVVGSSLCVSACVCTHQHTNTRNHTHTRAHAYTRTHACTHTHTLAG